MPHDSAPARGELDLEANLNPFRAHRARGAHEDLLAGTRDRDGARMAKLPDGRIEGAIEEVSYGHTPIRADQELRRYAHRLRGSGSATV